MRKKIRIGCLAAALLMAAGVVSGQQAPPAQPPQNPAPLPSRITPPARQLLDGAIQALGGQAFLHYQSLTSSGRVFVMAEGETAGFFPFRSTYEPPDKRRFSYGKSKPITLINNGEEAWQIDQLGRTHQNPEQKRAWAIANRYSLEGIFRYRVNEPGVLILASGVDFINNQTVDVLDMADAQNVKIKIYLDRFSHLPVRITYHLQNPATQDWDDYADDYSDYQTVQGIATPLHIARTRDDERVGESFRSNVKYNEPVPADYFQPPR